MGSRNTTSGEREGLSEEREGLSEGDEEVDYAALVSFLLRNGQVRLFQVDRDFHDDLADEDDDFNIQCCPETDVTPDTSKIDVSTLLQAVFRKAKPVQTEYAVQGRTASLWHNTKTNICNHLLRKRQSNGGLIEMGRPYMHEKSMFTASFLPNNGTELDRFPSKLFCGTYSQDGNVFLSHARISIYVSLTFPRDSSNCSGQSRLKMSVGVCWILAFSPDGCYLIYSSWSENIHICNIHGDYETHSALDLNPSQAQFCAFSIQFSSDNKEILAGANDGNLYIYDREKGERTLMVDAHEDDVNAVCFADSSSQILFSGGDDGLCKVWDRRMLSESNSSPVGTLAGHSDGITFIDTKGDTRHLISNSKDQSIKLWDMRCFSSENAVENARRAVAQQEWDYRWQRAPRRSRRRILVKGDTSLMTYRGHGVLHTLLRCRFSPKFTTDQNYIYSACATGKVI
ncbi:putative DDB1- and CUL4-associated factor 11, partial [Apostichopus japonicus]